MLILKVCNKLDIFTSKSVKKIFKPRKTLLYHLGVLDLWDYFKIFRMV